MATAICALSRRTEKGPRSVRQIYVGTADSLFQKLQGLPATPLRSFPFGKTAIITDLEPGDLPDEKVVEGFVARSQVEEDFKWLKDRHVVSVKPFYLWHDATVPGHVFLCVMGLLLLRYLQWELREFHLSMKELVELLERIRVVLVQTGVRSW